MKPDERRLLEELRRRAADDPPQHPGDIAAEIGISPKRCLLLCQGWWAKRWLERSADAAWGEAFVKGRLTNVGMTAALDGN